MTLERNVALIGMMGAGKSTIGRLVAAKLHCPFLDSDDQIERQTGKTVADIFRDSGEEAFRDWEAKAVTDALQSPEPVVLGVAGGAVLRQDTCRALKEYATVVWLCAPLEVLIDRVKARALDRPLIAHDPEGAMRTLYESRRGIYEGLADLVIDTSPASPPEIASTIVGSLS